MSLGSKMTGLRIFYKTASSMETARQALQAVLKANGTGPGEWVAAREGGRRGVGGA